MSLQTSSNRPPAAALPFGFVAANAALRPRSDGVRTAPAVDIERFMGAWYVIASVPTCTEKNACNAVEHFRLGADGAIDVNVSFRKGGTGGEFRSLRPRARVLDTDSNAIWGVRRLWPIRSEYRILYVDEDYSQAIIGRSRRDHVRILSRTPSIPNEDYFDRVQTIREQGYDTSRLRLVPQEWSVETAFPALP